MTYIKSWIDYSYKELNNFSYKGGRNVVGAKPFQMAFIDASHKSKEKTVKKYKGNISKFLLAQSDRIDMRYKEYFGLKADSPFPIEQTQVIIDFLIPELEDELISVAFLPMHTSAIQKAVEDSIDLTAWQQAIDYTLANAEVGMIINNIGRKLTKNINRSTKSMIKNVIYNGVKDGENILSIRDKIRATGLNEYYQGRSLAIARTETRACYDAGSKLFLDKVGGVEYFDVVGCVGTLKGTNELGLSAGYGDFSEDIGSCGVLKVSMNLWDSVSELHHINHNGLMVSSLEI